jgi:anaerobic magnesium-protoporphyrin IX monomethyl ester cyclase
MKNKVLLFFSKTEAEAILLPMSLLMVAEPLLKNGFEVKIIDQRLSADWQQQILDFLSDGQILAVGFSVLTGKPIKHALEASLFVREHSQAKIIWGGVHPSLLPEQTLANDLIDFAVIGEGEETMLELCHHLANQENDFFKISGIAYKDDGRIIINPVRQFINLDQSVVPPYRLIDFEKYVKNSSFATGKVGREIDFYTSRGCPYHCGFCYNKSFNACKWRGTSAIKVVEHMERLVRDYGITSLNIEDDEFFTDKRRVLEICRLMKEKNISLDIFACHRINFLDNTSMEDLLLLQVSGFKTFALGVESGSPRILKLINKAITVDQVLRIISKLKQAGIGSKYYFMVGFPTETIDDIYQTTDLMLAMKKIDPSIRIPPWRNYTPYPGTDLYNLSVQQGFKTPQKLEDWADFDFDHATMPWLDKKTKRVIANVVYFNRYFGLPSLTPNTDWYLKLSRLYGRTVDWRWRRHLFWAPEKVIIRLFLSLKKHF